MTRFLLLAVTLLVAGGCDFGDPGQYTPEPVLEAWLIAGQAPPDVRLTWTQDVRVPYDVSEQALTDAEVRIVLRTESGTPGPVFPYRESGEPGVYTYAGQGPIGENAVILPGRTYDLTASVPGYPEITATTVVPGDFRVREGATTSYVYQSTEQVEIDVTPSSYPGRQAVYIITIESLEPSIEDLTPFILDAIYGISGNDEFDPSQLDPKEIENVLAQSSPPLNEANWETNPDGTLKLKMPWFFVAFYGRNRITASAIDDNMWTFFRQINAQQGNGGLSPGEIPNITAGVQNGHGVFGSLTRIRETVDILRAN